MYEWERCCWLLGNDNRVWEVIIEWIVFNTGCSGERCVSNIIYRFPWFYEIICNHHARVTIPWIRKGGQVQLPKFNTSGRPLCICWDSIDVDVPSSDETVISRAASPTTGRFPLDTYFCFVGREESLFCMDTFCRGFNTRETFIDLIAWAVSPTLSSKPPFASCILLKNSDKLPSISSLIVAILKRVLIGFC